MSYNLYIQNKTNTSLIYALNNIYGIGVSLAKKICSDLGYDQHIKLKDLLPKDLKKLNSILTVKNMFTIDAELKKQIHDNIKKLKNIKCYKGTRHIYNLPVNGQRTKTNAKTRKNALKKRKNT